MRGLVASMMMLALLSVAPRGAAADAGDTERALAELQRGVAAFRAGRFAAAHEAFAAAQRLAPDKPNPYRWLALTEVQLGDCPAALGNIAAFLARVPADEPRVPELQRLRELCQQTGVLRVRSTPSPAELRIDGEAVGATPYASLSMRAGKHTLEVRKPGFAAASRSIDLAPGGELDLEVSLSRAAAPLHRRWWVWAVAAGVVATAVGVGVVVQGGDGTTVLPPVQCDDAGCR